MKQLTLMSLFFLAHITNIGAVTPYDLPWTRECLFGRIMHIFVCFFPELVTHIVRIWPS